MTETALTSLTEKERTRALNRFRMLCPFLEHGVPLTTVAKEHGVAWRYAPCGGGSSGTGMAVWRRSAAWRAVTEGNSGYRLSSLSSKPSRITVAKRE